jgi:predicted nucleotidyltransferase component of viral defense system
MLYIETVKPNAFSLLEELMAIDELNQFQLVGGTSLSLQLGHRMSDDLDLFSNIVFDNEEIIEVLQSKFLNRFELKSSFTNKLGIFSFIDSVKVDICRHKEILIDEIVVINNIRMWSTKEIAAAKVNAISRRATKKDFWDMDELLDIYSIDEIAAYYKIKYLPMLTIGVSQIITYFNDAEESENPLCLKNKTWEGVKKSIIKKINHQFK